MYSQEHCRKRRIACSETNGFENDLHLFGNTRPRIPYDSFISYSVSSVPEIFVVASRRPAKTKKKRPRFVVYGILVGNVRISLRPCAVLTFLRRLFANFGNNTFQVNARSCLHLPDATAFKRVALEINYFSNRFSSIAVCPRFVRISVRLLILSPKPEN